MEAFEILTSESQERMLAIVRPSKLERVLAVCAKWGLTTAVVATLETGGDLDVRTAGEQAAKVPALAHGEGPVYERLMRPIRPNADDPRSPRSRAISTRRSARSSRPRTSHRSAGCSSSTTGWCRGRRSRDRDRCRRRAGAGDDEGARPVGRRERPVRVARPTSAGPTRSPRPPGTSRSGARPLGITNCLNFGDPERPEVMWQFSEAVRGCGRVPRAGHAGHRRERQLLQRVGRLGDLAHAGGGRAGFARGLSPPRAVGVPIPGLAVYVLGESFAELGGSEFAEIVLGVVAGTPPALDLQAERRLQDLLQEAAAGDLLASAHDCSDGDRRRARRVRDPRRARLRRHPRRRHAPARAALR